MLALPAVIPKSRATMHGRAMQMRTPIMKSIFGLFKKHGSIIKNHNVIASHNQPSMVASYGIPAWWRKYLAPKLNAPVSIKMQENIRNTLAPGRFLSLNSITATTI
jgi:hypothetical protein